MKLRSDRWRASLMALATLVAGGGAIHAQTLRPSETTGGGAVSLAAGGQRMFGVVGSLSLPASAQGVAVSGSYRLAGGTVAAVAQLPPRTAADPAWLHAESHPADEDTFARAARRAELDPDIVAHDGLR